MTGFRLPAEAVEAGGKALATARADDPSVVERDKVRAAAVLSAALPVLAESPELVEQLARALCSGDPDRAPFGESQSGWPAWQDHKKTAEQLLRDLFAAAPTDTTEETPNG